MDRARGARRRPEMGPASTASWHDLHAPVTHSSLNETSLYFSNIIGLCLPPSLCTCHSLHLEGSSPASFSSPASHFNFTCSEKPFYPPQCKVTTYFPHLFFSHILFLGKINLHSTECRLNLLIILFCLFIYVIHLLRP